MIKQQSALCSPSERLGLGYRLHKSELGRGAPPEGTTWCHMCILAEERRKNESYI